jgi:phosphonopyruvate decarboxylase
VIPADRFCSALDARGVDLVTGVPCSYLAGPIELLTRAGRYLPAANEGAAVALAGGVVATGSRAAVISQNSGLGNLLNPLTSLHMTYRIPLLVFLSLRGWPDPMQDEPQHRVMGRATHGLLDALGVTHWTLRPSVEHLDLLLDRSEGELTAGRPTFILVPKRTVEPTRPVRPVAQASLSRTAALRLVLPRLRDVPVVATTGYTSRALFALGPADHHFYMQGSMGHAMAFGLGLAVRRRLTGGRVVVLDGDGAALMHLGTMSTIGAAGVPNLVHLILDNQAYESTGAQSTTSATTDLAGVAAAAGYPSARTCATSGELTEAIDAALTTPGPHLICVRVAGDEQPAPPRATASVEAPEIYRRFTRALGAGSAWQPAPSVPWDGPPADRTEVLSGPGSSARLPLVVARYRPRRVLVVATQRGFAAAGARALLDGLECRLFSGFTPNPSLRDVLRGCRLRDRWHPDLIVGLGGGSALDTAKAIRLLPSDEERALACLAGAGDQLVPGQVPLVLVPTTAGSGSEVTRFATVFRGLEKLSLDDPRVSAEAAIVDPELTRDCPLPVTSSCAYDILCHAVESFWSRSSTDHSRALAEEALAAAIPLLHRGLRNGSPGDRAALATAATRAGQAIDLTRTTAAHAFAYRFTAQFGIPHGVACLLNLRWLFEYNAAYARSRCADERGEDFCADRISDLEKRLLGAGDNVPRVLETYLLSHGWPTRLRDYGISRGDLPVLARAGVGHRARASRNPVRIELDDVLQSLTRYL